MPTPIASAMAPATVAEDSPAAAAPNATPTASPSGILCSVIASTSSTDRRQVVCSPSAAPSGASRCMCGSTRSRPRSMTPPARKPISGGSHIGSGETSSAISMAGASSDQKLAAIITPAAKPSIVSSSLRLTVRVRKTVAAPRAVMPQVKPVASRACKTGCRSLNPMASTVWCSSCVEIALQAFCKL